jgi:hypothetical protein
MLLLNQLASRKLPQTMLSLIKSTKFPGGKADRFEAAPKLLLSK